MPATQRMLLAQANWIFSEKNDSIAAWTRAQALRLSQTLCGSEPLIKDAPAAPYSIAVGTPGCNSVIGRASAAGLVDFSRLSGDDYFLKQVSLGGQAVLLIAGNSARSAGSGATTHPCSPSRTAWS